MFKVGEIVRWMEPLDPEYSYGKILSKVVTKHLRYIKHLERGSRGESTKHSK